MLTVFRGNGDGTFKPGVFYLVGEQGNYVVAGDFNGDRKPDLAVVDGLGDAVRYAAEYGGGSPITRHAAEFQEPGRRHDQPAAHRQEEAHANHRVQLRLESRR